MRLALKLHGVRIHPASCRTHFSAACRSCKGFDVGRHSLLHRHVLAAPRIDVDGCSKPEASRDPNTSSKHILEAGLTAVNHEEKITHASDPLRRGLKARTLLPISWPRLENHATPVRKAPCRALHKDRGSTSDIGMNNLAGPMNKAVELPGKSRWSKRAVAAHCIPFTFVNKRCHFESFAGLSCSCPCRRVYVLENCRFSSCQQSRHIPTSCCEAAVHALAAS